MPFPLLVTFFVVFVHGMTYRDNCFEMTNDAWDFAQFVVTNLSIPLGQDPNGYNYIGMTVDGVRTGLNTWKFCWSVGRSNDASPAQAWNQWVGASQNDHGNSAKPDNLNFAFRGNLFTKGSNIWRNYTSLAFGQGHYSVYNDWWFGGKYCQWEDQAYPLKCTAEYPMWCVSHGRSGTTCTNTQPSDRPAPDDLGMSYHDNCVPLWTTGDVKFSSAYFVVANLDITSGQDPNGYNKIGMNVTAREYFPNAFELCWRVGRSNSDSPATSFNGWTRNHNDRGSGSKPEKLNFAFLGNLFLKADDGTSWAFTNLAFGQGHTGLRNDWWFGGAVCKTDSGFYVLVCPTSDKGHDLWCQKSSSGPDCSQTSDARPARKDELK